MPIRDARTVLAWNCSQHAQFETAPVEWLRFDSWDIEDKPRVFATTTALFSRLTIAAIDADGSLRQLSYTPEDGRPVLGHQSFSVPLPRISDTTSAIIVRFEQPRSAGLASHGQIRGHPLNGTSAAELTLLAIAVGILVMPLLFDALFYLVLRERFVLLHAAMTLSGLAYILTAGGVITAFVLLPITTLTVLAKLSFALGAGLNGLFISAFIERDALSGHERRLLKFTSLMVLLVTCIVSFPLELPGDLGERMYLAALGLTLPSYALAITVAIRRGSKGAWFMAAAFLPIFLAGLLRLFSVLAWIPSSMFVDQAMFLALDFEVLIVATGVAFRFLALRHERDRAITTARMMKQLSERDSLTGLLNRRVIEDRFAILRQEGFDTVAALDLDHFKRVNDTFGHATGDDVLRVVGKVLESGDEDIMAFRMGGEEFLLLLRGEDALEKAEQRRQEISRAIASENLGCLVTASMGIVESRGGALRDAGFTEIYERADALLYEAKESGRNRMVSERIRAFRPRGGERRAAA